MKWAVLRRWLGVGRTEPEKLKGHLSNDRVETMRLSMLAHRELGKGQKKSGSCSFRPTQDPRREALTERWRNQRRKKQRKMERWRNGERWRERKKMRERLRKIVIGEDGGREGDIVGDCELQRDDERKGEKDWERYSKIEEEKQCRWSEIQRLGKRDESVEGDEGKD